MNSGDLEGLKDEDFGRWKQHPMSKVLFAFFEDQVANYRENAADLIEGSLQADTPLAKELRGRILTLRELLTLSLVDVRAFYAERDNIETEAASGT